MVPWEEMSLPSLEQMGEVVLSSELCQSPLCHQVMSELHVLLISVSCSSVEAWRREEEPDHSTMLWVLVVGFVCLFGLFCLYYTEHAEWKFTLHAGKLETIIFVHDSTVSSLLVSTPLICVVFLLCC